jgi:hypothetical protein
MPAFRVPANRVALRRVYQLSSAALHHCQLLLTFDRGLEGLCVCFALSNSSESRSVRKVTGPER